MHIGPQPHAASERRASEEILRRAQTKQTARTATNCPRQGWESDMRKTTGQPRRDRRRRGNRRLRLRPGTDAASSQTTAGAIQLAIALLTASLDSPELQVWAFQALALEDPAALGDLLAGQHILSQLLLHQLHEATGQPPADTLQRLAILVESCRDTPPGGR
jgi:hypothetical protein